MEDDGRRDGAEKDEVRCEEWCVCGMLYLDTEWAR